MGKALGPGKTTAPPTLPAPFQSVAQQAFDFGDELEKKPVPLARGIAGWMLGRLRLKYRVALSVGIAAAGGVILTFAAMMVYYTVVFPDPLALRNNDRAPLIRILARDGTTIAERGAAHEYVRLADLPKLIPAAVVATDRLDAPYAATAVTVCIPGASALAGSDQLPVVLFTVTEAVPSGVAAPSTETMTVSAVVAFVRPPERTAEPEAPAYVATDGASSCTAGSQSGCADRMLLLDPCMGKIVENAPESVHATDDHEPAELTPTA